MDEMKAFFRSILIFYFSSVHSQEITQINSGTNTDLLDISIIKNNIVICGLGSYLVKSYDECGTLIPLSLPASLSNFNRLQRIDTSLVFSLHRSSPSSSTLYKSTDGGYNWIKKQDTSLYLTQFSFFDSYEGIVIGSSSNLIRTLDGGNTWSTGSYSLTGPPSVIKVFGDSMVCVGEGGAFYLSKDRGHTWPYGGSLWSPIDFFFLNMDTIFGLSLHTNINPSNFTKTFNGGVNWVDSPIPLFSPLAIFFKSAKEGYVVGANTQTMGVIIKTTDLGQSWYSFNTGIQTQLTDIAFLNDSIALLTGTDGVLLKWNYKNTVFTEVDENTRESLALKVVPNPVMDKLKLLYEANAKLNKVTITNALGQTVLTLLEPTPDKEIDVSFLVSGIYYLRAESNIGQKVLKIIKE
jgi:hypothetical protein